MVELPETVELEQILNDLETVIPEDGLDRELTDRLILHTLFNKLYPQDLIVHTDSSSSATTAQPLPNR